MEIFNLERKGFYIAPIMPLTLSPRRIVDGNYCFKIFMAIIATKIKPFSHLRRSRVFEGFNAALPPAPKVPSIEINGAD